MQAICERIRNFFDPSLSLDRRAEIWYNQNTERDSLRLTDKRMTAREQREYGDFPLQPTVWAHLILKGQVCPFHFFKNGGKTMKKIGIVMGSDSDLPVVKKAMDTLDEFGVPFEVHVFSAHRTPKEASDFAKNARKEGFGAIIAAAGMAAHLAGAVAANTTLPVVGIPCKSSVLDGVDALYSTVQMPSGIPVATVAINGGVNAALLCVEMLAVGDDELCEKLEQKRASDSAKVLEKNKKIELEFNK